MSHYNGSAASVTPTQANLVRHGRSLSHQGLVEATGVKGGTNAPPREGQDARSLANLLAFGPRGASLAPVQPPGSFSSDLKTVTLPRAGTPRADLGTFSTGDYFGPEGALSSEQRQKDLRHKINKETKIKIGSENLLEALISKNAKQTKDQRQKVESELTSSNRKLLELHSQLEDEIEQSKRPTTPSRDRLSGLFQGSPLKSPTKDSRFSQDQSSLIDQQSESPTFILSEILQALEIEGMQPDYYVERANNLVELLKRYPTLKYDLAWAIFGLRMQTMLLSESREVIAAGYRVTRHAIADRQSLQTIRSLNTDNLVILSLVKENKASVEREQALKFVRAFLDVKGGIQELSIAVMRTVVAVAEHQDDRLRNMSLLTISEVLVRDPAAVISAGGIASLANALGDGSYNGPEYLAMNFLHLLDNPKQRVFLQSGYEIDSAFTPFTDPMSICGNEEKLKSSARVIASILKTWPGLFSAARQDFQAIRSLLQSLQYPVPLAKDLLLDLFFDVLHIQPPSWTPSFLAGRRLTTYGRVANLKTESSDLGPKAELEEETKFSLMDHFTSLTLACFMHCGLVEALSKSVEDAEDSMLRRKGTLLLSEVLKLADYCLPPVNAKFQALPELLTESLESGIDQGPIATGTIYQIDSVNRTLHRSRLATKINQSNAPGHRGSDPKTTTQLGELIKSKLSVDMDELQFRALLLETQVLTTANYLKWKWDMINDLIRGPLLNAKRLEESIKASKFMKRLVGFYRPFKYKFSDARNTKPNQRYVRIGCALIRTLLANPEGIAYLMDSKLLRQLAECLAQLDRQSGLTSASPLFSPYKVSETLTGGYFTMLGTLSSDLKGLHMLQRWRMTNMFYHIMELEGRDDLVRALLSNMDFSLDSHLRVMLSKALTACPKNIRIFATRFLRKYVTPQQPDTSGKQSHIDKPEWAIRLLVTQLYDPEVQVCEIAVQILEEVCNQKTQLEYVVRCRPALDHLGAIGAPLLLRFLSTSLGYQYLDGLDYITQEMDDWFLGRNDSYVTLVEASISRALMVMPERPKSNNDEQLKMEDFGTVPPHFYRELTRTVEGCRLLKDSGHFDAFVANVYDSWSEQEDTEVMLKLKGSLWAIGNIGSMELGGEFLQETDVVEMIIKIATSSKIITMRGTAFYVLGLISRSLHGMEILTEYGWSAATDHLGRSLGYCLPSKLEDLFVMDSHKSGAPPQRLPPPLKKERSKGDNDAVQNVDPIGTRVLALTADLGNTVITGRAASDLFAIKTKSPETFTSVCLFRKVMLILEKHSFSLRTRRFIIDLFDKSVMRRLVLDYDSGDESVISPAGSKSDARTRTSSDTRSVKG